MDTIEGFDELDALIASYKLRVKAGEIKVRKAPVRPLPNWPAEKAEDRAFWQAQPDEQRRAYAHGRVLVWAQAVRNRVRLQPWLVTHHKVTPEQVLQAAQVDYRAHAGTSMPAEAMQAVVSAVFAGGLPEAPAEPKATPATPKRSAGASPAKPKAARKLAYETGPYALVKRRGEVVAARQ